MGRIQERIRRTSRTRLTISLAFLALSIGMSAWMVFGFASAPAGYAAAYTTGAVYVLACVFAVSGLVLISWRRTRWFGWTLIVSALWFIGFYLATINIL